MKTTEELFLDGVALGTERVLGGELFLDRLATAVAEKIALRFELLEPKDAAALLSVTPQTLRDNHVAWRLDKSVAFGLTNPRFFLSQVIERARERVVEGRKTDARTERRLAA